MTDGEDAKSIRDEWDTPEFKHGLDIGKSFGLYEAEAEAIAAFEAGEIELWIGLVRPKTFEEWDAWEAEHGTHEELKKRWLKD